MVDNLSFMADKPDVRVKNSFRALEIINMVFATSSILLLILPVLQVLFFDRGYTVVMMITMGGFVFTALCLNDQWFTRLSGFDLMTLFIPVFYLAMGLLQIGNIRSVLISVCTPFYLYFIFAFYSSTNCRACLERVGGIVLLAFLFTILTTLIAQQQNPYIARQSGALSINVRTQYMYQNVGGVSFVYAAGLLAVMFLSVISCKKNGELKHPFVYILVTVMCGYLALTGSSGITIFAVFSGLLYFPMQNRKGFLKIFVITVIALLFVVLVEQFANFLQSFSNQIGDKYISIKLADIASSLLNDSATGDVAARTSRYMRNIQVFIDSWGFGIGPIYGGAATPIFARGVSEHSQLLADLGRYGMFGLILFITFFWGMRKRVTDMYHEYGVQGNVDAVWVVFLSMYILQPVFSGPIIAALVFLVFPVLPKLLLAHENGKKRA